MGVTLSMSVARAHRHMPKAAPPETRPPILASRRVTTQPLMRSAAALPAVSRHDIILAACLALLSVVKDDIAVITVSARPHMAYRPLRLRCRTALIRDWPETPLTASTTSACTSLATAASTRRPSTNVSAVSRPRRLRHRLAGTPHSRRIAAEEE